MTKTLMKVLVGILMVVATASVCGACMFSLYQPKVPSNLLK